MRIRNLLNKRMWLGLLTAVAVVVAMVAVSSLLIVNGIISEQQAGLCVCVCYGISVLTGCLIAAFHRDHAMVRAVTMTGLLLALAWLTALGAPGNIVFEKNILAINLTVLFTGMLAGFLCAPTRKGKRKSHRTNPRKR